MLQTVNVKSEQHEIVKKAAPFVKKTIREIIAEALNDWLIKHEDQLPEGLLNGIENKAETENQEVSG